MAHRSGAAGAYKEPRRKVPPLVHKLRARRYDLGWSQTYLAVVMGYSPKTIANLETGQQTASSRTLYDWADALGMELTAVAKTA